MSKRADAKTRKKFSWKPILIVLLVSLCVCAAGFALYVSDYYHADDVATQALSSDELVQVEQEAGGLVTFAAKDAGTTGLIFYPGGKVEASAYAPLMRECAQKGFTVVLCEMPCNLAFFDVNAADRVMAAHPEVTHWYVAGHSLGGVAASFYAEKHADRLDGLVLLAAYSTKDLHGKGLSVLSLRGSEDGVLNQEAYEENLTNFPDDVHEVVIPGGNHAGFGSYGAQEGDGASTLPAGEQARQSAELIAQSAGLA